VRLTYLYSGRSLRRRVGNATLNVGQVTDCTMPFVRISQMASGMLRPDHPPYAALKIRVSSLGILMPFNFPSGASVPSGLLNVPLHSCLAREWTFRRSQRSSCVLSMCILLAASLSPRESNLGDSAARRA
jgi:hypothetical protein